MRAMLGIVLLCLLETAMGNGNYSWHGPGGRGSAVPSDNLCVTDQSSCGCCVMLKELEKLEQYVNRTLGKLENDLARTTTALTGIKESRTAFSVSLTPWRRCVGPVTRQITVAYEHMFINIGQAYDASSGVFTAPHSGVYSLALTVWSDAGSPGALLAACATLYHNGDSVASVQEKNYDDQEDTASIALVLQLAAQDTVAVRLPPGCFLCDDQSHFNTFSGFLLYTTE